MLDDGLVFLSLIGTVLLPSSSLSYWKCLFLVITILQLDSTKTFILNRNTFSSSLISMNSSTTSNDQNMPILSNEIQYSYTGVQGKNMNKGRCIDSLIPVSRSIVFLWKSSFLRESLLKLSVAANIGPVLILIISGSWQNNTSTLTNLIEGQFHHS